MLSKYFYRLLLTSLIFGGLLGTQQAETADPIAIAKKALCHSCLAKIYASRGEIPQAITEYEELLKLTPNDAAGHFDFGNLLARNNKPDMAATQFKAAARIKPNVPEYQVGLGNALMYTKNYSAAVQAYTKACSLGGKYQSQLQMAQQYEAQQKLLEQYKQKVQSQQE